MQSLSNMHIGEAECVAIFQDTPDAFFCSGDKCAIKYATFIGQEDRIISLEAALAPAGRHLLAFQYSRQFRDESIQEAYKNLITEPTEQFFKS